ncbi:hypothetical protein VTL71DRAFT_3286 [Oculimacula yallundae]|uniref:Uncharacterized protein n=1 Tax=Oculimacula yallundae TaxID=86028 RepID=A0ABR4C7W6_9HELO
MSRPVPSPAEFIAWSSPRNGKTTSNKVNLNTTQVHQQPAVDGRMFMLPTRLLPPQFLLPAWNSRQLAQAAQWAHKREFHSRKDRKLYQEQNGVESAVEGRKRPSSRQRLKLLEAERALNPALNSRELAQPVQGTHKSNYNNRRASKYYQEKYGVASAVEGRNTPSRRRPRSFDVEKGLIPRRTGFKEQSDGSYTTNQLDEPLQTAQDHQSHESVSRERLEFRKVYTSSQQREVERVVEAGRVAEEHFLAEDTIETQSGDQEPDPSFEGLSLFEELFPEEAMARQKREKRAMERFEKLPAFNWDMDTKQLDAHDRRQQEARQKTRDKYHTIPLLTGDNRTDTAREILPVKQIPKSNTSSQRTDQSRTNNSRVAVLVLSACSKRLEETDFYRVGPKGNHIENWTSGILKVIPARDNVTLEPLGQYYLLFSSYAAARLYLDKTQRLLYLSKSNDFFSRNTAKRDARLREDEDLEAVMRNFTMVPTGGKLYLRLLEPPYSKGIQWMIDAAGPASLVVRQNKSQHLVLFSTDSAPVKQGELENAIMDDGKRRNLHWKLAGAMNEAVVQLETKAPTIRENAEFDTGNERRSTYQGAARYTISFKDSNEARRFAREWHRRPFPSRRVARPEEDAPPIYHSINPLLFPLP